MGFNEDLMVDDRIYTQEYSSRDTLQKSNVAMSHILYIDGGVDGEITYKWLIFQGG